MIDLRSDTVTKPSPGMLAAMQAAAVGDDVYGEDDTVNRLESRVAELLGTEAALFVPSGTMSNQIAIRLHCRPGEEMLCERTSHVVLWEAGGPAALSGVSTQLIDGEYGLLTLDRLKDAIRPKDMHSPQTKLVCLENTHNRGGGTVYSLDTVKQISTWAKANGLAMHLDGARLWNAIVATGVSAREWASHFDTVSVCFSKGLGAPVGSALAGPKALIDRGRWVRKLFGGAMRQAGYLAAACIYALDHHIERLADDHANAQLIADAVRTVPQFQLTPPNVETNLVWFEVDPSWKPAADVTAMLREQGIKMSALGTTVVRACTHLDVSRADCKKAAKALQSIAR